MMLSPMPDATAALAMLDAQPIPLLMSDYHLSNMRGDALAAAAKAAEAATKVWGIDNIGTESGAKEIAHNV